jgi:pilus assembly protein Flp/PilA
MKDEPPRYTATFPQPRQAQLNTEKKEVGREVITRSGREQSGQGMVEYALILVLVSIVVIVILLTMGNQIQNVFSNVVAALGA